jgi:hypothetical protein
MKAEPTVSLLYDAGTWAAEWNPDCGPLQVWHKCEKDAPNAQAHYFYDYHDTEPLSFSQLAVEDEALIPRLMDGAYDAVFLVLRSWAQSRQENEEATPCPK